MRLFHVDRHAPRTNRPWLPPLYPTRFMDHKDISALGAVGMEVVVGSVTGEVARFQTAMKHDPRFVEIYPAQLAGVSWPPREAIQLVDYVSLMEAWGIAQDAMTMRGVNPDTGAAVPFNGTPTSRSRGARGANDGD